MVSETGPCGELTVLRVPLPLDPAILLDGAMRIGTLGFHMSFRDRDAIMSWVLRELARLRVPLPLDPVVLLSGAVSC